ncbi:MAG: sigma-70 family RNA polymerase sigma factor [Lachnospiraceae bacterium]|nr:sigma-70 family RNA polymerase sigma factor [Lachnospiraceae bacterium]
MNYGQALNLALSGKDEGYDFLYNETFQKSYYVALKYMKNEDAALDVLQEAYVKAFSSLEQLQDANKFPAWFSSIVASKSLDALRKRNVTLFSQMGGEDSEVVDFIEDNRIEVQPELAMDQAETGRIVQEILDGLSEEQRFCIMMYYMDQMSVKEIAQALGVSENTVKSRLNYGRKNIKGKVQELEKKGVKLLGLAPVAFFAYLLMSNTETVQAATKGAVKKVKKGVTNALIDIGADVIKGSTKNVKAAMSDIIDAGADQAAKRVKGIVNSNVKSVSKSVNKLVDANVEKADGLVDATLKKAADSVDGVVDATIGKATKGVNGVVDSTIQKATQGVNGVADATLQKASESAKDVIDAGLSGAKETAGDVIADGVGAVTASVGDITGNINSTINATAGDVATDIRGTINNVVGDVTNSVNQTIDTNLDDVKDAIGQGVDKAKKAAEVAADLGISAAKAAIEIGASAYDKLEDKAKDWMANHHSSKGTSDDDPTADKGDSYGDDSYEDDSKEDEDCVTDPEDEDSENGLEDESEDDDDSDNDPGDESEDDDDSVSDDASDEGILSGKNKLTDLFHHPQMKKALAMFGLLLVALLVLIQGGRTLTNLVGGKDGSGFGGLKAKSELAGTWKLVEGNAVAKELIFRSDGTVVLCGEEHGNETGAYRAEDGYLSVSGPIGGFFLHYDDFYGNYKVNGKTLTITNVVNQSDGGSKTLIYKRKK